jgi:hypothetical protein
MFDDLIKITDGLVGVDEKNPAAKFKSPIVRIPMPLPAADGEPVPNLL